MKKNLSNSEAEYQPQPAFIFRPLIETPLEKVKVMILGSEPPSMMSCDGLAYSFPKANNYVNILPNALMNIFEEYERDLGFKEPKSGNLKRWADQGVLLWNETPTVKKNFPKSHLGIGWHKLTNEIIETLYLNDPNTVFILWTPNRDLYIKELLPEGAKIIDSPPPSLVAVNNFFGSAPFTKTNTFLKEIGKQPVLWRLP